MHCINEARPSSVFEMLNKRVDITKLMSVFVNKLEMMNPHDNNIKIIQTICTKCSGELVIIIIGKIIDMLEADGIFNACMEEEKC